jgi:hypothetical protein
MFHNLTPRWALFLLAMICLLLAPMPFLFFVRAVAPRLPFLACSPTDAFPQRRSATERASAPTRSTCRGRPSLSLRRLSRASRATSNGRLASPPCSSRRATGRCASRSSRKGSRPHQAKRRTWLAWTAGMRPACRCPAASSRCRFQVHLVSSTHRRRPFAVPAPRSIALLSRASPFSTAERPRGIEGGAPPSFSPAPCCSFCSPGQATVDLPGPAGR